MLAGFLLLKNQVHFSTDVSAFLPEGKHKTLASAYQTLSPAKEVFVAVEGLDAQSLAKIKTLETTMLSSGFFVPQVQGSSNPVLSAYLDTYRYFTQAFTPKSVDANKALAALAQEISSSPFYQPVDTKDPLGFFAPPDRKSVV